MKNLLLAFTVTLLLSSCGTTPSKKADRLSPDNYHGYYKIGTPYQIEGEWYYPREQPDYDRVGVASWYGDQFHGKKTANGDTFDKHSLTAAHNTLPLPSMVRVTNLENNKTLILMINDRGPFAKGRILDVSERAAQILGFRSKGIAKVRVQFLEGHTKRLLADLPKVPEDTKRKFTFFDKGKRSYETYDDYDNKAFPLDIMPTDETEEAITTSAAIATSPAEEFATNTTDIIPEEAPIPDIPKLTIAEKTPEINIQNTTDSHDYSKPTKWVEQQDKEPASIQEKASKIADIPETLEKELQEENITFLDTETIEEKPVKMEERHFVQAGTYGVKNNAIRVERILKALGEVVVKPITLGNRTLYQVRLGPMKDANIAKLALNKVIKLGHADAVLVRDMVPTP